MKKKKRRNLILQIVVLLSVLFIFAVPVTAKDRKGSICVKLDKIGTSMQGVKLACYPVGLPVKEHGVITGWEAGKEYASLNLELNDINDTKKHRETADRLEKFVNHNNISPVLEGETDEQGKVCFQNLEQGMYLVIQKSGMSVYGKIQPFLVPVPYMEEGILIYDVETQTKGELPVSITATPTEPPASTITPPVTEEFPEPSGTPENPNISYTQESTDSVKTGDKTPLESMMLLLGVSFICISILAAVKKTKRQ